MSYTPRWFTMSYMSESDHLTTDPAAPEDSAASVHAAGETAESDTRHSPAAGGTVDEIRASDLQKLMKVVEAAVGLYNALEAFDPATSPWEVLIPPFNALGAALAHMGLEEL